MNWSDYLCGVLTGLVIGMVLGSIVALRQLTKEVRKMREDLEKQLGEYRAQNVAGSPRSKTRTMWGD